MRFKKQITTATIINNTEWTRLNGSEIKFDAFNVYERSGELAILIADIPTPGTYYETVPASSEYEDVRTHEGGIYAKTQSAASAVVEFASKTKVE